MSGVREEASQDVLENNRDVVGGHYRRAVVRAAAKGIALFPRSRFHAEDAVFAGLLARLSHSWWCAGGEASADVISSFVSLKRISFTCSFVQETG